MQRYSVKGMSCSACSARVEKAVKAVEGVDSCAVSLLTGSMGVEGSALPESIIRAVEAAGYEASVKDEVSGSIQTENREDEFKDRETPKLLKSLIASAVLLLPLMYISMGHMMWGWPVPAFLENNHVGAGIIELLLTVLIMVINQRFFIRGIKGVIHKAPNMDTLVSLGAGAAFCYSVCSLLAMTAAGSSEAAAQYMDGFYFESAAMILTLITAGKTLEARSKGKTTDAVRGLMSLAPKTARLIENQEEKEIPASMLKKGDLFAVRPGESFPADGIIKEGRTAVNESALTGESLPADKAEGDRVSAAAINISGFIVCEAERVGEDTALSQIIRLVNDTAATKAPIARIADKVSGIFVPVVTAIALITFVIWITAGESFAFALGRAIAVLVISCPCALGLATPVAIMTGSTRGARNGILFKTAASLEELGRVKNVALDKTGTITNGEPEVTDVIPAEGYDNRSLLELALSLESRSEHPLAGAVRRECERLGITAEPAAAFKALPGSGAEGSLGGEMICGGNAGLIRERAEVSDELLRQAESLSGQGKTPLFFCVGNQTAGIIAAADTVREDSAQAVRTLKELGIHVVMITGDNKRTAKAVGDATGVDEIAAEVLPQEKEAVVRRLMKTGKTAMTGDGINDAPALTCADVGIAIGNGTDIAIDAADVVLMKSSLMTLASAVRLSRAVLRNIHENLFWAFIYNVIGIPLAAGALFPAFGLTLNPMIAAAAMSLSSFCVVMNALRLNRFRM